MLKRNYWEIINFPDSPELWVESELNEKEREQIYKQEWSENEKERKEVIS